MSLTTETKGSGAEPTSQVDREHDGIRECDVPDCVEHVVSAVEALRSVAKPASEFPADVQHPTTPPSDPAQSMIRASGDVGNAYSLSDEAAELIETLPDAARNFRQTLREEGVTSPNAMGRVQEAAGELERAAQDTGVQDPQTSPRGVTRVQVERPKLNISDCLWSGTLGAAALAGQTAVVLVLGVFHAGRRRYVPAQAGQDYRPSAQQEESHSPSAG